MKGDNLPPPSSTTQRGRILHTLVIARGAWVPLPEITKLAAQYSARVKELRSTGYAIENRIQTIDGKRHSWFRLPVDPPKATAPAPKGPALETLPLFGREEVDHAKKTY